MGCLNKNNTIASNINSSLERPHDNEGTDLTNITTSPENKNSDIGTENPYTVRREGVQPRRTLVQSHRRSSFSYPNQSPKIPYRTKDIEVDSNELRPLDTGRSEPTSRTSTPTLQNFSINSP